MSKPRRLLLAVLTVALAAVMIGTIVRVSRHSGEKETPLTTTSSSSATTTQGRCQTNKNMNDYQMNVCLIAEDAAVKRRLTVALDLEAHHLISTNLSQARRVVNAAETTYGRYVRAECLAEANPYMGGTISPIIFGDCEVNLYQQRLRLVKEQTTQSLGN